MALADVVHEAQEPSGMILSEQSAPIIKQRLDHLSETCIKKLKEQGFTPNQIRLEPYLHLRYEGTDCALMCAPKEETGEADEEAEAKELVIPDYGNFVDSFLLRYKSEFGFVITGRRIIVDDIRVRGAGNSDAPEESRKSGERKTKLEPHSVREYFFSYFRVFNTFKIFLIGLCKYFKYLINFCTHGFHVENMFVIGEGYAFRIRNAQNTGLQM